VNSLNKNFRKHYPPFLSFRHVNRCWCYARERVSSPGALIHFPVFSSSLLCCCLLFSSLTSGMSLVWSVSVCPYVLSMCLTVKFTAQQLNRYVYIVCVCVCIPFHVWFQALRPPHVCCLCIRECFIWESALSQSDLSIQLGYLKSCIHSVLHDASCMSCFALDS